MASFLEVAWAERALTVSGKMLCVSGTWNDMELEIQ